MVINQKLRATRSTPRAGSCMLIGSSIGAASIARSRGTIASEARHPSSTTDGIFAALRCRSFSCDRRDRLI